MSSPQETITKLKQCIYSRDDDTLLRLLEETPNLDLNFKYEEESFIHLAVKSSPAIVETLIRHGADVNAKDGDDENTPLHVAIRDKRAGMVKILLTNDADVNRQNKQGNSSLHVALQKDHFPIVKELLSRSADGTFTWKVNLDQQNKKGESPRIIINNKDDRWKELITFHRPTELDEDAAELSKLQTFEVTDGGLGGMEGNLYQVLMFLLIGIRARKLYRDFQIMTEIKEAGKLDDIVIRYQEDGEWHWRFIQLKHKNSNKDEKNKITTKELRLEKGQFGLVKYIDSIISILNHELFQNDISEDFIVCTTASFDETESPVFKDKSVKLQSDPLLYFKDNNFQGKLGELIKKEFEEQIVLSTKDKEWKKKNESILNEIYEKFYFLASYPNVALLKSLILNEINQFKNPELINDFLIIKVLKHILEARGEPMNKSDVDELIGSFEGHISKQQCTMLSDENISSIQLSQIQFKEPLPQVVSFLNSRSVNEPLIIKTGRMELALINILNELKVRSIREEDIFVFNYRNLQNVPTRKTILKTLNHLNGAICVFIECQSFLEEIMNENFKAKVIFIEKSLVDHENDRNLSFESLTEENQNNLISNKNHYFGEIDENIVESYVERNLTIELIKNDASTSSNTTDELRLEQRGIERKTLQLNSIEDGMQIVKTLKEQEFLEANNTARDRVIAVVGDPGMGKSSLLKNLKVEMEKKDHWVILLNLNDFTLNKETQTFHLSKANFSNNDTNAAVEFLLGMMETSCKLRNNQYAPLLFDLLRLSLLSEEPSNLPGPVILLDAFDEISPIYEENVFRLVEALKLSNVFQIWLTTRPHEIKKLSDNLQSINYTLAPFNATNKLKYLMSYFESLKNKMENDKTTYNSACKHFLTLFCAVLQDAEELKDILEVYKQQFLQLLVSDQKQEKFLTFKENIDRNFNNMLNNPLQFTMLLDLCTEPVDLTEMNITEIYERFIDRKFKIFFQKISLSDGENAGQIDNRQLYEDQHYRLACSVLFLGNESIFSPAFKYLPLIARVGLITKHGDNYAFIHKSYAEFLAAKYFLSEKFFDNITLLKEILFEDSYRMLCTFLNDELKKFPDSQKGVSMDNKLKENPLFECNKNGENLIHVSAERGHSEIIKHLRGIIQKENSFKELLMATTNSGETILDKAAISLDYNKLYLTFQEILGEKLFSTLMHRSNWHIIRVIETASKSGKYQEMINFLSSFFSNESLEDLLSKRDRSGRNILHFATLNKTIIYLEGTLSSSDIMKTKKFHDLAFKADNDGWNCLHYGAKGGNIKEIISFAKKYYTGFEIIERLSMITNDGLTVFHIGVLTGHFTDVATAFIDVVGEDEFKDFVFKRANNGWNCFHCAAQNGTIKEIILFIKNYFKGSEIIEGLSMLANYESTVLHIGALNGHFTEVATVLIDVLGEDTFKDFVFRKNKDGWNCFHCATYNGNMKKIILFVKKYLTDPVVVESLSMLTNDGSTLLHIGVLTGHFTDVASVFIDVVGQDTFKDFIFRQNNNGYNCFHCAAQNGNIREIISFVKNYFRGTEIIESLSMLLDDGSTLLHIGAFNGYFIEVATAFIDVAGEDKFKDFVFRKNANRWNCFHCAAQNGYVKEMISILKKYFPDDKLIDTLSMFNNDGSTVLHIAALNGHFADVATAFIDVVGEDKFKDLVFRKNNNGYNCFHCAVQNGYAKEIISFVKNYFKDSEIIECLSTLTNDGSTVLHIAALNGYFTDVATVFINVVGEDEFKDFAFRKYSTGWNCFHFGAQINNIGEMVSYLDRYFPETVICDNLSSPDNDGDTIFHIAAFHGHFTNVASVFIDLLGEDKFRNFVFLKNVNGKNCLHNGIQKENVSEMISFLKRYFSDAEITDNIPKPDNEL